MLARSAFIAVLFGYCGQAFCLYWLGSNLILPFLPSCLHTCKEVALLMACLLEVPYSAASRFEGNLHPNPRPGMQSLRGERGEFDR